MLSTTAHKAVFYMQKYTYIIIKLNYARSFTAPQRSPLTGQCEAVIARIWLLEWWLI